MTLKFDQGHQNEMDKSEKKVNITGFFKSRNASMNCFKYNYVKVISTFNPETVQPVQLSQPASFWGLQILSEGAFFNHS